MGFLQLMAVSTPNGSATLSVTSGLQMMLLEFTIEIELLKKPA